MGQPLSIRFADGTERCCRCKGLGLVRAGGGRVGTHYRTLAGAQSALASGRAVDCPACEGCGIVNIIERVGA